VGVFTALISAMTVMGVELALTQRLQLVHGYTPLQAGAFMTPISLAAFFSGPLVGLALRRTGVERALFACLCIAASGLMGFLMFRDSHTALQILSMILFGFGAGGGMAVASTAIMISAPEDKAGMAAAIDSVSYEIGGAIGIAIMGGIITFVYSSTIVLPPGLENVSRAKDSLDQAILLAEHLDINQARLLLEAAKSSFDHAFSAVLTAEILMLLIFISIFIVYLRSNSIRSLKLSTRNVKTIQEDI
jgi:DHA2 family multidrug resistance protein-like MFS transporter